ncbi:MAG TPA: hypothetical protein V6C96_04455 [Vampirovibrionales bacterium]
MSWKLLFFIFTLFTCSLQVSSGSLFKQKQVFQSSIQALNYLDQIALYFEELECERSDAFCWWFKFHKSIGDNGPRSSIEFANSVPSKANSKFNTFFVGESHVFQYPAYWLVKGVPLSTKLSSGKTLKQFIEEHNWEQLLQKEEDSWYQLGNYFLKQPSSNSTTLNSDNINYACGGSHKIIASYLTSKSSFQKELNEFLAKLEKGKDSHPSVILNKPQIIDPFFHSFEVLCSTINEDKFSLEQIQYHFNLLQAFSSEFERSFTSSASLKSFINEENEIAYTTAEMLGHYRYGLRLCINSTKE